jgi:tRNA A-37 threonylcarbamoyl transferase component Bud32
MFDTASIDPDLLTRIAATPDRIQRLEHRGQFLWVKREERLSLRMRLQKGATASAFERERAALHRLAEADVPVPPILAEGADFFVTPDSGPSLEAILRQGLGTVEERLAAFRAAAGALAGFHAKHLSHGRPSLKDICWQDGRVTFIDFENFSDRLNTPAGHAQDVVKFFFNGLSVAGGPVPELDAARDAYRAADPGGIWEGARAVARRMRWLDWLTRPVQMRRDGKAREFKAIPLTLDFFGVR